MHDGRHMLKAKNASALDLASCSGGDDESTRAPGSGLYWSHDSIP